MKQNLFIKIVLSIVLVIAFYNVPTSFAGSGDWRTFYYNKYKWSKECENDYQQQSSIPNFGLQFFKLTKQYSLVKIQCTQAAYQGQYEFMIVKNPYSKNPIATPFIFETRAINNADMLMSYNKPGLVGNPIITTSPLVIKNLEKGRGLGDCGVYEVYSKLLSLSKIKATTVRVHPECDGNTNISTWKSI